MLCSCRIPRCVPCLRLMKRIGVRLIHALLGDGLQCMTFLISPFDLLMKLGRDEKMKSLTPAAIAASIMALPSFISWRSCRSQGCTHIVPLTHPFRIDVFPKVGNGLGDASSAILSGWLAKYSRRQHQRLCRLLESSPCSPASGRSTQHRHRDPKALSPWAWYCPSSTRGSGTPCRIP
jgi:hypothetical protein